MGKLLIDESTLTDIGNAIRTKKGTSGLIPTPNMKSEILSISGGGGTSIDGGYTVNFHDLDGKLIETHSAKYGNQIGNPLSYKPLLWNDAENNRVLLPLTVTEDMGTPVVDLYAGVGDTYADKLYKAFGKTKEEYPVVFIKQYLYNKNDANYKSCAVYFAKSISYFSSDGRVTINSAIRGNPYAFVEPLDIKQVVDAVCELPNNSNFKFEDMAAQNNFANHYIYINTGEKLNVSSNKWYDLNVLYGDDTVELT